jgi:hypothetical protein
MLGSIKISRTFAEQLTKMVRESNHKSINNCRLKSFLYSYFKD